MKCFNVRCEKKKDLLPCAGCKSAFYCSLTCARYNSACHSKYCKQLCDEQLTTKYPHVDFSECSQICHKKRLVAIPHLVLVMAEIKSLENLNTAGNYQIMKMTAALHAIKRCSDSIVPNDLIIQVLSKYEGNAIKIFSDAEFIAYRDYIVNTYGPAIKMAALRS